MSSRQRIAVLGSTGSIGKNTLDVVARHPERFVVQALAARRDVEGLVEQIGRFQPAVAVVVEPAAASAVAEHVRAAGWRTRVECGADALVAAAEDAAVDTVVAGVVGAAGLPSSLAAARAGKRILLANKEALVMAGALFMKEVQAHGATLLPIDSEHNAIFQCWPGRDGARAVRRILLTASGGPFRTLPASALRDVTVAEACAHPNWSMGPKISVDSATMMNKGLELIEACWLFDVPPARVEILIHPESVVHSLVEYVDGSVLAQLGQPDMRTPIAHALAWPDRVDAGVDSLDLIARGRLHFEAPDIERFPCLRLAREVAEVGGTQPAILNAANEEAVAAFLGGRVGFMTISDIIAAVLAATPQGPASSLEAVYEADRTARAAAQKLIQRYAV